MKDENVSQDWVSAGLAELARGGVDGARVEMLADGWGVTKGGFYRRFKNRRALRMRCSKAGGTAASPRSSGRLKPAANPRWRDCEE